MNNSDQSLDPTFLFDKEESLLSDLTIVFFMSFITGKARKKFF